MNLEMAAEMEVEQKRALIDSRRQKLEKIKEFISLKTYHIIDEKLHREIKALSDHAKAKKQLASAELKEQNMPKVFFEQKFLRPKLIRIN